MTTYTETTHVGEWLISEAESQRSRDAVTVAQTGSTTWLSGTLLGKVTATGKYVKYADGASDGSQTVAGILYNELAPATGDIAVTIINCDAEVAEFGLTGLDSAGRADLLALGIKVR